MRKMIALVELARRLGHKFPLFRKLSRIFLGPILRQWVGRIDQMASAPIAAQIEEYEHYRINRQQDRQSIYPAQQESGLLSFITTVWNTDPAFVKVLAESVFAQNGGTNFEWFILDNGSTVPGTIEYVKSLGSHPCVNLHRVENNLGIIGGMRYCL